jgi:Domain of unknown function (DUF4062)
LERNVTGQIIRDHSTFFGDYMANTETTKRHVFLSSTFREQIDGEKVSVPLRRRILDNCQSLPVDVWAYDILPEYRKPDEPDADTIIDRCFLGVRQCDLFVFLLTGRHGSGVSYGIDPVLTSYLELELFAAAILQKPVLVLHQRGRNPEPALHDALDLLHRTFPADRYVVDDDDALYARVSCRM